jgi:hypothetical protein
LRCGGGSRIKFVEAEPTTAAGDDDGGVYETEVDAESVATTEPVEVLEGAEAGGEGRAVCTE